MSSRDSTLKFLIFILIFVILVFIFVLFFVIPSIKDYKTSKSSYSHSAKILDELGREKSDLSKSLEELKIENQKVLDRFLKSFSSDEFIEFTKEYFDDAKLTKIENETNSSALNIYNFTAKIKAKNPKKFYDFINNLPKYDAIIKIDFPITISSKNNLLEIDFRMSVYSMSSM